MQVRDLWGKKPSLKESSSLPLGHEARYMDETRNCQLFYCEEGSPSEDKLDYTKEESWEKYREMESEPDNVDSCWVNLAWTWTLDFPIIWASKICYFYHGTFSVLATKASNTIVPKCCQKREGNKCCILCARLGAQHAFYHLIPPGGEVFSQPSL